MSLKKNLPDDVKKRCEICEYARKIEISGEIICTRTKNLKKVTADDVCRRFSFDILSYKPLPSKLPKFTIKADDIL